MSLYYYYDYAYDYAYYSMPIKGSYDYADYKIPMIMPIGFL